MLEYVSALYGKVAQNIIDTYGDNPPEDVEQLILDLNTFRIGLSDRAGYEIQELQDKIQAAGLPPAQRGEFWDSVRNREDSYLRPYRAISTPDHSGHENLALRMLVGYASSGSKRQDPKALLAAARSYTNLTGLTTRQRGERVGQSSNFLRDHRLKFWFNPTGMLTFDNRTGSEGDGRMGNISAGIRYRMSDMVSLGAQARFNRSRFDRDDDSLATDSNGHGGAVYAKFAFSNGLEFEPLVAYQRNWTDITEKTGATQTSGTFATDIWTVGAKASKRFWFNVRLRPNTFGLIATNSWLQPTVGVSHVTAHRDSWTRSDGTAISGSTIEQGSANIGFTSGMRLYGDPAKIPLLEPTFGAKLVWNYEKPDAHLINNNLSIETPEVFGSLSAGLNATFTNGWRANLSTSYSGIGSDVQSISIGGKLTIPFGTN